MQPMQAWVCYIWNCAQKFHKVLGYNISNTAAEHKSCSWRQTACTFRQWSFEMQHNMATYGAEQFNFPSKGATNMYLPSWRLLLFVLFYLDMLHNLWMLHWKCRIIAKLNYAEAISRCRHNFYGSTFVVNLVTGYVFMSFEWSELDRK